MALADRHRRQIDPVGDVADRIDVRRPTSANMRPPRCRHAASISTPACSSPRPATLGLRPIANITRSAAMRRAVRRDARYNASPCLFDRRRRSSRSDHRDAARLPSRRAHARARPRRTRAKCFRRDRPGVTPRPEAGKDAGELQRDIAAALDHDAARQRRQMKRLVRRDHVLDAGDGLAGRSARRRSRSRYVSAVTRARRSPAAARVPASSNTARVLTIATPAFSTLARYMRFQPGDLLVLVGDQGRPVEARPWEPSSRSPPRPRSHGRTATHRPAASSARSRG